MKPPSSSNSHWAPLRAIAAELSGKPYYLAVLYFIDEELVYNAVFIPALQQTDSAPTYVFFLKPLSIVLYPRILNLAPRALQ